MVREPVYDTKKKNWARTKACIRGLISIYLVNLGCGIFWDSFTGKSDVPLWVGVLIVVVFVIVAALYGVSAWRRYKADLKAAEMSEEEIAEIRAKYPDPACESVEYDEYLDDYLDEDDDEDDQDDEDNDEGEDDGTSSESVL